MLTWLLSDIVSLRVHISQYCKGVPLLTQRILPLAIFYNFPAIGGKRGCSSSVWICDLFPWTLKRFMAVLYTHLRAHETGRNLVCRLLLEKKNHILLDLLTRLLWDNLRPLALCRLCLLISISPSHKSYSFPLLSLTLPSINIIESHT